MWEEFLKFIFFVLNWLHGFVGDWGIAIILITIIFRILIYPITRKQFKSTYAMQKIQPQMAAIKAKYADDPAKQQEEMMKLYAEVKFNPLSGCLPMLLQMPIFIALFQVLSNLQKYIGETEEAITFLGIVPDLTKAPQAVFSFSLEGVVAVIPYVILVLLFGVSMLIPMLLNKNTEKQTKMITGVMSIMMIGFGWISPAGVLLYWDASSLIGVAQQALTQRYLKKKDEEQEAIEIKPIKVEVERKEHKARPTKKNK